ncbi:MAG TPA: type II secretion system protein [Verrucomicrobiae bacterium]|nr:type II secretion system protein [Verrucomicrobiae bacterium]
MVTRRAFTLIELLVTVGILTLIAAFVTPTYQLVLSQLQLNSAVQEVAEHIRLAQQKTVSEQNIYGITFTAGSGSVPLFLYNPADGTKTTQSTISLPAYITVNTVSFSGNSDIRFTTSGAPNYSGSLTIRDSVRSKSRTIEIRPSGTVITSSGEL